MISDVSRVKRVFISYSHDSSDHEDRVLALEDRLATDPPEATKAEDRGKESNQRPRLDAKASPEVGHP
jgi:hypothetical protein